MKPLQKQAGLLLDAVENHPSIRKLGFDRDPDRPARNLQELFSQANQLLDRQRTVSSKVSSPNWPTIRSASFGPMPRTILTQDSEPCPPSSSVAWSSGGRP